MAQAFPGTFTITLARTYAGLIPMLFVPGNHVKVERSVDVYLIDVREGFI
ncbi:MAG: hypothetical protein R6V27_14630 [Balneolaceae bacterium]